ncbi:MAG: SoxR reducing system RseC family protein [Bacteroidales bacterium]|nr:SoxR reducing system RseC family protein [Bacteroidales bacterium]
MVPIDCIGQKGIIEQIVDGTARVNVTNYSACSACKSKESCLMGESKSDIIEASIGDGQFSVGETVEVFMHKSMGNKAVVLAYILPFLVLFLSLVVFTSAGFSDLYSGILSLSLLVPYYIILYLSRKKLEKKFSFSLKKES